MIGVCEFLAVIDNPDWWDSKTVVALIADEYPLLFCTMLAGRIKGTVSLQWSNFSQLSPNLFYSQQAISFLGTRLYYWLGNNFVLGEKQRTETRIFLQHYNGPNCFIFFTDTVLEFSCSNCVSVNIPQEIDREMCVSLLRFLLPENHQAGTLIVQAVFALRRTIHPDTLVLLVWYARSLGDDLSAWLAESVAMIVVPESSLFDLSKYLLGRNQKLFFKMWSQMAHCYGDIFWVSYWSDIIWRAYHFTILSRAGSYNQAKKFCSRLPFSFVHGGWKQIDPAELGYAINFLYDLDLNIKNGSSGLPFLDLWYLTFFQRYTSMTLPI